MSSGIRPQDACRPPISVPLMPETTSLFRRTCNKIKQLGDVDILTLMPTLVSRMARHPGMNLSDPGITMPVTPL